MLIFGCVGSALLTMRESDKRIVVTSLVYKVKRDGNNKKEN